MSDFILSVVVDGPDSDPNHRSHWALAIHRYGSNNGILLQVSASELSKLVYQFETRRDVVLRSKSSEGSFVVASLARSNVRRAAIRREVPPDLRKGPARHAVHHDVPITLRGVRFVHGGDRNVGPAGNETLSLSGAGLDMHTSFEDPGTVLDRIYAGSVVAQREPLCACWKLEGRS